MRKIAVLFGAAAIVASGVMATPAKAQEVVDELVDDVRARVCVEEHGYGVVDCSATIDPHVDEVKDTIEPVVESAEGWARFAGAVAWAVVQSAPGVGNYAYCWVVDPENPYCQGPLHP